MTITASNDSVTYKSPRGDTERPADIVVTYAAGVVLPDGTVSTGGSASTISTTNSTSTNLANGAAFTGTAVDVSRYAAINVSVFASHASATNGLSMQQSSDGTNWDITDTYTVPAATGKTYSVQVAAKWFRLVYTNGGTLTTSLRIQTLLKVGTNPTSSVRMQDGRSNENDVQETAAYAQLWDAVGLVWNPQRAAPYQINQIPLAAGSGNVANASAAATLTGTATTTVYISGFEVTGAGATVGLPVTVTVAGLLGGTRSYTYTFTAGALLPNTPLVVSFVPPLPASAANTPVVVTCPASGTGGTNNTVVAHGYYQ
jgi:hypothetical protein